MARKAETSFILGIILVLSLILTLVLAGGCKNQESKTTVATIASPVLNTTVVQIESVSPADSSSGIAVDTEIQAVFSQEMNSSTINSTTFTLQKGIKMVEGQVTCIDKKAVFKPLSALEYGSTYTATITTEVKGISGSSIEQNKTWSFTTVINPKLTTRPGNPPPSIISVNPADKSTGISINTAIEAVFSVEMDAALISADTFILQRGTTRVAGTVIYSEKKAIFRPLNDLEYHSIYTAMIASKVKGIDGQAMEKDMVWSFTTLAEPKTVTEPEEDPPVIISVKPVNLAIGIPVTITIEAVFSKEMDSSSINSTSFIIRQGTTPVSGIVTCSGTKALLKPAASLSYSTVYRVLITREARDLAGKNLTQDYEWSFTTEAAPVSGGSGGVVSVSPTPSPSPTPTPTPTPTPSPTPTPTPTPTPVEKTVFLSDADLPKPPAGFTFHFVAPDAGDPGTGKIMVGYKIAGSNFPFTYPVYFGVENNQLWVSNLPMLDSIPASLVGFYNSLGIDENTVYDQATGKYRFTGIPAWVNISKYDPNLTEVPVLISASSGEGQAQITYLAIP